MLKRFWWVFVVMIPVGALCGLLFAAVVTYVMPKKYESEVTLEVKPLNNDPSATHPMTPQFFGTEFEKITSRNSLGMVVETSHPLHRLPEGEQVDQGLERSLKETNYLEAKREFELEQACLQELRLKQIRATELGAQDSVIIHEEPQIAQVPASPNVTVNLVLGTALGLLLSPLMALPLIFLLGRFIPQRR